MKNILVINAHQKWPGFAEGNLNQHFADIAIQQLQDMGYQVKTTTIENGYQIDEEIEKHIWSDGIVIQSPVYWMSVPWMFKKYVDEILTYAIGDKLVYHDGRVSDDPTKKYGTGAVRFGRKIMLSLTLNAPSYAFEKDEFFNGLSAEDLLQPINKAYEFCGFESLPTYAAFDVIKNPDLEQDFAKYKNHLRTLFS